MKKDIAYSKQRLSNFELLRIVAMFFIIAHHCLGYSNLEFGSLSEILKSTNSSKYILLINNLWLDFYGNGGKIGVCIFILISGYFLIDKDFKSNKILKLYFQSSFYVLLLYIVACIFNQFDFNVLDLISELLFNQFAWNKFLNAYFVLFMAYPFFNILLNKLTKKEYKLLLFVFFILCCVVPSFTPIEFLFEDFDSFLFIYALGGYIKRHYEKEKSVLYYLLMTILFMIVSFIIMKTNDLIYGKLDFLYFIKPALYTFSLDSIYTILISLSLFMAFKQMNIKYNKVINTISKTTFGIYLIHDNIFVKGLIWNIFNLKNMTNSIVFIPYSILEVLIVFIGSMIIECLREKYIEKLYINKLNSLSDRIDNKILDYIK